MGVWRDFEGHEVVPCGILGDPFEGILEVVRGQAACFVGSMEQIGAQHA